MEALKAALDVSIDPSVRTILNVYLLTHCIIAETLFYSRSIPEDKWEYYSKVASMLEHLCTTHWDTMTIDSKLEVALCLQLVGHRDSGIIERAVTDAEDGYDTSEGFIKDPTVPHKNDLEWAEHRNVLYLLVVGDAL